MNSLKNFIYLKSPAINLKNIFQLRDDNSLSEPTRDRPPNPQEFTILEPAKIVIELTGSRSKIVHAVRPEDDPRQRRPDISRLGWAPTTALRQGLECTIEYFGSVLSAVKTRGVSLSPVD